MKNFILSLFLFISLFSFSQKISISGIVVEEATNQPLEFATIILEPIEGNNVTGGVTDTDGKFDITLKRGTYNITIEFLSFESLVIKNKELSNDTDIGIIKLHENAEALDEIEVIAEKSTVEFRLDKKIYNVGKDMTVKGGSASDVLDNVPSVTVDVEGNVSLRGNESVRILINGKPSGLVGLNGNDALRQLPADAIAKVEIITSPSARYEAEGTAGIINIVLRKGKALGFNGSVNLDLGTPTRAGTSASLNYRTKKFNYFTTTGYSYSDAPGNAHFVNEYLNPEPGQNPFLTEDRVYNRERKNFNILLGTEYFIADKTSVTGSVRYSNSDRTTDEINEITELDSNSTEQKFSTKNQLEDEVDQQLEFNFNFTQSFNNDDHKLTADFRHETTSDDELALISGEEFFPNPSVDLKEKTSNLLDRTRIMVQSDYVLPIGENAQFEAGYRSNFNKSDTEYILEEEESSGDFIINPNISNIFTYNENIHALYSQYGNKFGKFSALLGLRMEISDIDIISKNSVDTEHTKRNYTEFFPTANLSYEFNDTETLTLGYNRRIRRPHSYFLNPNPSRGSTNNIFQGNPYLYPAYSNNVDLGFLKKWDKVTFNTSIYYNYSTDVWQFVRYGSGSTLYITPINVGSEDRLGWEFSVNYSPFNWWKLNGSFNYYKISRSGAGLVPDYKDSSWFTRINSRVKLPAKIDWQTTFDYRAGNETFQSKTDPRIGINLAFSKDVLKDKATLSLNVSDLLNSRKRKSETIIEDFVHSTSEFQWRERQIRLSFTYRFNQKKKRERSGNSGFSEGEGGF